MKEKQIKILKFGTNKYKNRKNKELKIYFINKALSTKIYKNE